jgi:hypothetical protein
MKDTLNKETSRTQASFREESQPRAIGLQCDIPEKGADKSPPSTSARNQSLLRRMKPPLLSKRKLTNKREDQDVEKSNDSLPFKMGDMKRAQLLFKKRSKLDLQQLAQTGEDGQIHGVCMLFLDLKSSRTIFVVRVLEAPRSTYQHCHSIAVSPRTDLGSTNDFRFRSVKGVCVSSFRFQICMLQCLIAAKLL